MSVQSINDCSIQTRGTSLMKMPDIDLNRFYLVENINTKQRHVISHLFVKNSIDGSSATVQCKSTPRGCRFEAKIIFKGHRDQCEKKLQELRLPTTPSENQRSLDVNEIECNQSATTDKTHSIQGKPIVVSQKNTFQKPTGTNEENGSNNNNKNKNNRKKVIRRKQFGNNNITGLFDGVDPPSRSTTNQSSTDIRTADTSILNQSVS